MSNINRERNRDSLSTVLQEVLAEWAKLYLHTSTPGIVETYDPTTRRARVRPALRLVKTGDIPGEDGEAVERALAVNVPVMWLAAGGGSNELRTTRPHRTSKKTADPPSRRDTWHVSRLTSYAPPGLAPISHAWKPLCLRSRKSKRMPKRERWPAERVRTSRIPPRERVTCSKDKRSASATKRSASRKLLFPAALGPTRMESGAGRTSHAAMLR